MFTGIVENIAKVVQVNKSGTNMNFEINSSLTPELKIDQSIAHNGICLTVTSIDLSKSTYTVTAIEETIHKTTIGYWKPEDKVNLERCMIAGGRLDGHMVQGHVDGIGICTDIKDLNGSWKFTIEYGNELPYFTIDKGSICLNGISLTVVDAFPKKFTVHIIPFTYEHTTMNQLKVGSLVNLEFDVIGKYFTKYMDLFKNK